MKITDLAIIFVIFTLPLCFMLDTKTKNVNYCTYKRIELNRILDTAVEDGATDMVETGSDKKIIINKEKGVGTFFNSLYVNFDITVDKIAQKRLESYVPVIVILDYDGYYVFSNETYIGLDGYKEVKQVWKPKKMYVYKDSDYIYSFSLDQYVTVYDVAAKSFSEGNRVDLMGKFSTNIIKDEDMFERVRRRTIIESIKKDINYYINKHNDIARRYGITYHFTLPTIEDDDWYRTIDDVGMLVFFQGLPIGAGSERFNSFALGGSRIVKTPKYYVDIRNGIKRYHIDPNCPLLSSKDEVLNSKKECAQKGYFPCSECNP